ncbi:hypothetical protein [Humidesulfovibrio sp.]
MYAVIIDGTVAELLAVIPALGPGESAVIMPCGANVQPGWRLEAGVLAPPPPAPEPSPNADIDAQILALEALQTPRLLREALRKKQVQIEDAASVLHGLTPEEAIAFIDTQVEGLRAQRITQENPGV